jgi:hypothetical protein
MTVGTSVTKRPFEGERIVVHTTLGFDATCEEFRRLLGNSSFSDLAELARSPITQAEFENQVQARFVGESGFMLFAEFDHRRGSLSSVLSAGRCDGSLEIPLLQSR